MTFLLCVNTQVFRSFPEALKKYLGPMVRLTPPREKLINKENIDKIESQVALDNGFWIGGV